MVEKPEILIIDADKQVVESLSGLFKNKGYKPFGVYTGQKGLELALNDVFELILLDSVLPDLDSLELVKRIKGLKVSAPVIVLTTPENKHKAIDIAKNGAVNILFKPLIDDLVIESSNIAINQLKNSRDIEKLRHSISEHFTVLGHSEVIEKFREKLKRIAGSNSRALFFGESGSGKEAAARYVHYTSSRSTEPFHGINCLEAAGNRADKKHHLECDLFGYERDAFVGASTTTKGRFEMAEGGTVYLNEVGSLTPDLQSKLLRMIETGSITRMGATSDIKVDLRILAGTTIDLEAEVKAGRFREDLYFRLNVIPTAVPPLRDYKSDIPFISRKILDNSGQIRKRFEMAALSYLKEYDWPGNIRQLDEIVTKAAKLSSGDIITVGDVKSSFEPGAQRSKAIPESRSSHPELLSGDLFKPELSYRDHVLDFEFRLLQEVLDRCKGNITKAAEMFKTDRGNLSKKIKKLGIKDSH